MINNFFIARSTRPDHFNCMHSLHDRSQPNKGIAIGTSGRPRSDLFTSKMETRTRATSQLIARAPS